MVVEYLVHIENVTFAKPSANVITDTLVLRKVFQEGASYNGKKIIRCGFSARGSQTPEDELVDTRDEVLVLSLVCCFQFIHEFAEEDVGNVPIFLEFPPEFRQTTECFITPTHCNALRFLFSAPIPGWTKDNRQGLQPLQREDNRYAAPAGRLKPRQSLVFKPPSTQMVWPVM